MNDYSQIHLVHGVTHEHLVHTKVLYIPESIVYQVSTANRPKSFVVGGIGSSRMGTSRLLSPIHNWALLHPLQIQTTPSGSLSYLSMPGCRCFGPVNGTGKKFRSGGFATMACLWWFAGKCITFLKQIRYISIY